MEFFNSHGMLRQLIEIAVPTYRQCPRSQALALRNRRRAVVKGKESLAILCRITIRGGVPQFLDH